MSEFHHKPTVRFTNKQTKSEPSGNQLIAIFPDLHIYAHREALKVRQHTKASHQELSSFIIFVPTIMAPQAWFVEETGEDPKSSREFLPLSKLEEIGVFYWHLDPKKAESDGELTKIRKERGYSYMDLLEICPDKLENYEEKLKNFFCEHMHADEEIRYCLEGSGYFDVRDKDDHWIRIWIKEGDLIILPAGIYHRFTLDSANHVKLMRLFVGEPVWTAYNRPQEDHPARQEYVKSLMGNTGVALAAH